MRVLQLIDTLTPGGAERVAVTYANELSGKIEGSYICCTRKKGLLEAHLRPEVELLSLNKKSTFDVSAIRRLRKFIKEENIDIVHAHSSSFFLASVLKMSGSKFKLVWHDHYGNRDKTRKKFTILQNCSRLFSGTIVVNERLLWWAKKNIMGPVTYIPNFIPLYTPNPAKANYQENGTVLINVANLKPPKNHLNLLKAFNLVARENPKVKLVLIGKSYSDNYLQTLRNYIKKNNLGDKVVFKGQQQKVYKSLETAHIGIISSDYEGLPLALLEYGMAGLAVVCTNVGDCEKIIGGNGKIVPSNNPKALAEEILFYINNKEKSIQDANSFHNVVINGFSEKAIVPKIIEFYKKLV